MPIPIGSSTDRSDGLNPNTLAVTSKRLARYKPESYRQHILNPIERTIAPFDSIGMNDLFHCVPGSMTEKAVAFDHLRKLMNHGCQVFGSTMLQGDVPRSWAARRLMNLYNEKGIFSNTLDWMTWMA